MGQPHSKSKHRLCDYLGETIVKNNQTYDFEIGENVILTGNAKKFAQNPQMDKSQGADVETTYLEVAQIVGLHEDAKGKIATLQFFLPGKPYAPGGVGIPAKQANWYIAGNIKPLPFYTKTLPIHDLETNAQILTCQLMNVNEPWQCESCDHDSDDPKSISQQQYENELYIALQRITQKVLPGETRYTVFTCPQPLLAQTHSFISMSEAKCKTVIIATTSTGKGVNKYALVALPDVYTFKSAILSAYGLPLKSEYFHAVDWHQFPLYNELVESSKKMFVKCIDVKPIWVEEKVKEMLQRGYEYTIGENTPFETLVYA